MHQAGWLETHQYNSKSFICFLSLTSFIKIEVGFVNKLHFLTLRMFDLALWRYFDSKSQYPVNIDRTLMQHIANDKDIKHFGTKLIFYT